MAVPLFQQPKTLAMYSLNIDKLRDENLPVILRKPVLQALVSVLQSTMLGLHSDFMQFKAATDIRLAHNGQVYLLRKILNDTFDPYFRRITVVDAIIPDDHYIANPGLLNQAYIASGAALEQQFYLGNPPGYFGSYDFIINIPAFLEVKIVLIKQLVDNYKMAGKTYGIKIN